MRKKQVSIVDVQEFDKLVKETYGKPYSFQQQDGCKDRGIFYFTIPVTDLEDIDRTEIPVELNGNIMGVSFETWRNTPSNKFDENFNTSWKTKLFWHRNFYPDVSMILDNLYKRGLLEKGEYGIDIDW